MPVFSRLARAGKPWPYETPRVTAEAGHAAQKIGGPAHRVGNDVTKGIFRFEHVARTGKEIGVSLNRNGLAGRSGLVPLSSAIGINDKLLPLLESSFDLSDVGIQLLLDDRIVPAFDDRFRGRDDHRRFRGHVLVSEPQNGVAEYRHEFPALQRFEIVPENRRKDVPLTVLVKISHGKRLLDVDRDGFRKHLDRASFQRETRVQFIKSLEVGNGLHDRMISFDDLDFEFAERIMSGEGTIVDSTNDSFDTVSVRLEHTDRQVVDDDSLSAVEEFLHVAQRQIIVQRGAVVSGVPKIEEEHVVIENLVRTEDVEVGIQSDFDVRARTKLFGNLRSSLAPIVILDSRDQQDLDSLVGGRGCGLRGTKRCASTNQQRNRRE